MIQYTEQIDRSTIVFDRELDPEFHLGRLHRFASVSLEPTVCALPWKARLARHATVSAFSNCVRLGHEAEARRVMALVLEAALAAEARRPRPPLPVLRGPRLQRG